MKRIIIFYISEFGGHSKAANNIKEAFHYKVPQIRVTTMNGLKYFYPRGEKIVDFLYNVMIRHIPGLWRKIYDRKSVVEKISPYRRLASRIAFRKMKRIIKIYNPDCFIATQAFPCGIIADYKEKFGLAIPVIAVVTDYHPHRLWIHPYIDRYVVACPQARETLIKEGVSEEKIKVLGIPISIKFLNSYHRDEIAAALRFDQNLYSVLLMGGGLGIGPIEKIARALDYLDIHFQIIVVCGKNRKLYKWFARNKRNFHKPLFYFSYVGFIHKLMDFSDIIITKAGGITSSEAIAKGMPIVITNPLPGQEELNVEYLLSKGAAVRADEAGEIAQTVRMLLDDIKQRYSLRAKAREISYVDSSLRIVDFLMREFTQ